MEKISRLTPRIRDDPGANMDASKSTLSAVCLKINCHNYHLESHYGTKIDQINFNDDLNSVSNV